MFVKLGFEFILAALIASVAMMIAAAADRAREFNVCGYVGAAAFILAIVCWGVALWTQT